MQISRTIRIVSAAVLLAVIWACGGGGGGGGNGGGGGGNGVTLNAYAVSLAFGQQFNFTGSVPGLANQVIRWSTNGGTISPTGPSSATYTAPSVAGTFSVIATADGDSSKFATATISVSAVGISIDPQSVTLAPNASTTFDATVVGATNTNATFSATQGTVVATGPHSARYTAPPTEGTYTITARAVANTSKTATATIVVANVGAAATVSGRVVVDGTTSGISGVEIAFYNNAGSEVARGTTNVSGSFSVQVPITARRFHVVANSLSTAYYKAYSYAGKRYSAIILSCSVGLPNLTAGVPYNLPSLIEVPSAAEPPPPPPNGCS